MEPNDYKFLELENKEELKLLTINCIAKSLMYLVGTDPEIALLGAYFIQNRKEPDINNLKNRFFEDYNTIDTLIVIPDETVIEIVKLVTMNRMTNYKDNIIMFEEKI